MNKQECIDYIFGNDQQEFALVDIPTNQETKCICEHCNNKYFYRLVNDYIICTKCFAGYAVDTTSRYYIKKL